MGCLRKEFILLCMRNQARSAENAMPRKIHDISEQNPKITSTKSLTLLFVVDMGTNSSSSSISTAASKSHTHTLNLLVQVHQRRLVCWQWNLTRILLALTSRCRMWRPCMYAKPRRTSARRYLMLPRARPNLLGSSELASLREASV